MTATFIIGLFITIVIIMFCMGVISEDGGYHSCLSILIGFVALIGLGCMLGAYRSTPTALDVYQGKTELRITYDGKVPVDTIVIYKEGGKQ